MPKYGRSIKRRGKVKVTRKRKPLLRFKTRFVGDENVQQQWDHNLTVRQNYEKIGLTADPNDYHKIKSSIEGAESVFANEYDEKLFHVPDSDDFLKERNVRKPDHHMSEEEVKYLRKCIAKHGENYESMARDIKTNDMQWTEQRLRKRCARLALWDAHIIQN